MDDQRANRAGGGMKRFSIRDILLLCVIVAIGLGWWLDRRPRPTRYEIEATGDNVVVLDTTTGEVRFWKIDNGFETYRRSYAVQEVQKK
jgi:hypothetical protein